MDPDPVHVVIDLLEAENRRLKKFEEANGRLRKYNGELRHALIKEKAQQGQVIQISDDGGDDQLFSNESGEEVNPSLQSSDNVLFNPIIRDRVFKNLDVKNIKKCRLICKSWNEMVSHILSRQNGGYGLAVRLEEGKLKGMSNARQQHTIQGLSSVVAAAPQNWFSKALLDKNFARSPETQSVLLDFGYWLRSIEITGHYFLFQDVYKILADWCPNLEQLALPPCLLGTAKKRNVPASELLKEAYENFVFTRPLQLTSLFMQSQLCISVVKSSPNLKTLSLRYDSDDYSSQFFKDLLHCSEVTRNLENVIVNTGCKGTTRLDQTIKIFNSFQFSSKLKTLTIEGVGKLPAKELSEALKKLGGTLEKLVLIIDQGMDVVSVFPRMNKLTELRFLTNATSINSIEFLIDMPNLKTLYLGQHKFVGQEYFIKTLFSDCQQLRRNPRTKLKELYLFGTIQSPSPTFEMMNKIFPNLTKLVVGMSELRHCNDWEESQNSYAESFFGGISELPNLKDLYLDIRRTCLDYVKGFDCTSVILNHLNKLSNVSCLTIRDNSNLTITSLNGDTFLNIPNLRQVTLIGLKLDRVVVKELTILLYKHDIQLDIEDSEMEEDFRVHFEEQLTFRSRKLL